MDSVIRNVSDLSADERHVYENVLGQALHGHQRVVVSLENVDAITTVSSMANDAENSISEYEMWADLSDDEIAELESAVLHRSEGRPS